MDNLGHIRCCINFFLASLIFILGLVFRIVAFTEAPFLIMFVVLYFTALAYSFLAMVIVAISNDFKTANKITYTFIIVSIFLEIFFSQRGVLMLFFLEDKTALATILEYILSCIPSFPFS